MDVSGEAGVGQIQAFATSGRGLNVEELSELALRKIIHIADTAPPALRDQVHEFRGQLKVVLMRYMHQAIASDRTTLYNNLRGAGQREAAELILRI